MLFSLALQIHGMPKAQECVQVVLEGLLQICMYIINMHFPTCRVIDLNSFCSKTQSILKIVHACKIIYVVYSLSLHVSFVNVANSQQVVQ